MLDKESLLNLYKEYTNVLGPYTRKDNRQHVILNNANLPKNDKNKLKTISYPKALVESIIGRTLLENETIDHIDRNYLNNSLDNLRIVDKVFHAQEDAVRVFVNEISCQICNNKFKPSKSQRNTYYKAGPFCSRKCAGKYGKSVQITGNKTNRNIINKEYFKIDK